VDDAVASRDVQVVAVDRDAERDPEMLARVSDAGRPELLDVNRGLDVDELRRRIDLLVLVAAGGEKGRERDYRQTADHGAAPGLSAACGCGSATRQRVALQRDVVSIEVLLRVRGERGRIGAQPRRRPWP
jgi:hypothetical protein